MAGAMHWSQAGLLLLTAGLVLGNEATDDNFQPFYPWEPENEAQESGVELGRGHQQKALWLRGGSESQHQLFARREGADLQASSAEAPPAREQGRRGHSPDCNPDRAFPATIRNFGFVAGAHKISNLVGLDFQMFDVALYLDKNSELWHKEISQAALIQRGPGAALLRFKVTSGLINARRLAASIDKRVREHVSANFAAEAGPAMDRLVQIASRAKDVSVGSILDLFVTEDGVQVHLDGREIGPEVRHRGVAEAFLATFVGDRPDMMGFKDEVFRNLHDGWWVSQRAREQWRRPEESLEAWRRPKTYIVLVSVFGFIALLFLGLCAWSSRFHSEYKGKAALGIVQ